MTNHQWSNQMCCCGCGKAKSCAILHMRQTPRNADRTATNNFESNASHAQYWTREATKRQRLRQKHIDDKAVSITKNPNLPVVSSWGRGFRSSSFVYLGRHFSPFRDNESFIGHTIAPELHSKNSPWVSWIVEPRPKEASNASTGMISSKLLLAVS